MDVWSPTSACNSDNARSARSPHTARGLTHAHTGAASPSAGPGCASAGPISRSRSARTVAVSPATCPFRCGAAACRCCDAGAAVVHAPPRLHAPPLHAGAATEQHRCARPDTTGGPYQLARVAPTRHTGRYRAAQAPGAVGDISVRGSVCPAARGVVLASASRLVGRVAHEAEARSTSGCVRFPGIPKR